MGFFRKMIEKAYQQGIVDGRLLENEYKKGFVDGCAFSKEIMSKLTDNKEIKEIRIEKEIIREKPYVQPRPIEIQPWIQRKYNYTGTRLDTLINKGNITTNNSKKITNYSTWKSPNDYEIQYLVD